MRLTVSDLRKLIREEAGNVVSLGAARAKRSVFLFEAALRQFLESWNDSTEHFRALRATVPEDKREMLEVFIKEYITAGKNLSVFLRGTRLDMKKQS